MHLITCNRVGTKNGRGGRGGKKKQEAGTSFTSRYAFISVRVSFGPQTTREINE